MLAWGGVVAAVGWALATTDPAGRVLASTAVVLLGWLALSATVARPRLAADRHELRVGRLRGPRRWAWRDVHRIEVVRTRRLGRECPVLELDVVDPDGTAHLLVFTRLDLGADPVEVARAARELSAAAPGH